jgi:hypothetical protein
MMNQQIRLRVEKGEFKNNDTNASFDGVGMGRRESRSRTNISVVETGGLTAS